MNQVRIRFHHFNVALIDIWCRKPFSIIRDQQFVLSREALKASRKHLKKEGKDNKQNAADARCSWTADIERLWEGAHCGGW